MRIVAKYQKGGKSSKFNSKEPIYVLGYSKKATDQEVSSSLGKAQEHAQRRALKNVADTYRGSIEFYPMDEGYQYFIENEKKNIVINPPSAEDVERVRKQLSYDVFDAEFKRAGKSVLSKQFNGVKYLPTTRENVENNINSIPKGSNIMYMDHAGDNMFGRPKEEFADLIASRDPKLCIGGSCYGEEVMGDSLRSRLPNADIRLTKGEWPGFNPNKKGIDAILPKSDYDEGMEVAIRPRPEIPLAEPNILKQSGGNVNKPIVTPRDNTRTNIVLAPPRYNPYLDIDIHKPNDYGYTLKNTPDPTIQAKVMDSMLVEHGKGPVINISPDKNYRASYHRDNNSMIVAKPDSTSGMTDHYDSVLSELSHAKQSSYPPNTKVDLANNTINAFYLRETLPAEDVREMTYDIPGTIENNAHRVIQPKLEKEFNKRVFRAQISEVKRALNKQFGGNINTTGYTPGYESMDNAFNIIPSNRITMANTPFDVLGIPNKGRAKLMKAGLRKIVFPGADYVTEIPIKQSGGSLRNSYIKEGFQAHTADGHYIEPNNFRIRPSTLELDNITKIPGRFSTPDTYPNDINYNRHTNMSDEQHKYLQDAYAKLKGMYVETARTPAFDPNEQFILDQDNARQLDYTLLKNRFGIKQTGGNISAINLNTDLGPIPNFRRRITTSNPLPVASQYAQDGSVYPPNKKIKVNQDSQIKEYDISSPEYRDLYNTGKLMNYDKNTDTYIATPLKEVTITAEAPQWLKYKREYEKNNSKSDYINQYLTPFAKSLGNTETNYPKRLDNEYEEKSLNYASEQLVKNKPQGKLSRVEWLNQMSDKEEELIKRNPKYQSSSWADTKRGLTSLVEQNPLQTFQNILNSSDYSDREKQEMLKDYIDHPVMSKLGDAAKILNPLTVPSKMVQSTYKDNYSFTDALKGKKNNAGIVEDIVTDPLNLVGVGLAGKLSKADKVIDATKAGSKVLNKLDDAVNNINRIKFDDFKNDNEFFRIIVGDEAFDDIVQTQKIRTKQPSSVKNTPPNTINLDRRGSTAFPSFSKGSPSLSYANDNPNHYIIRTADESIKPSTSGRHGKGTTMFPTDKSGKHLTELDASKVQVYKHVGNGEYELVNTAKPIVSSVDDVVKNASLIPNWTVPKIKSVEEIDKLDDLHPVFKTFDKDTWKEIAQKKGNDYFLDKFNKQLVNVTNDLNSYENLEINISNYPEIIEGKKWTEDFVKSPEWKQRVKNANPDLTEEQINNLQKSTLLSMPSNMKTFIKNQASKNSFHGGQFTYDDLVHGRNVAFRYFTPEEVLEHPLHFKSLASHEFGHSQSSMRKLPNDKNWHQPLEESGDMMKTNDIYRGDRYVELSEEKRARSIPSYMFAKENNLLENGEFTEKTYDILKNMAEKDWKSVPNDFNSLLSWYDKKSAINYLNKFYATIPFYLYLQSQNQRTGYDPRTVHLQLGGMPALQPIQTEEGETAELPDNTFVKVAADQRHSQMAPGQITDAFPDQTYIFSDDPALRISKNIAKMIPIGQKLPTFREGKEAPEPETISLADRYFKNKKHMTPADLSKAVNSYFKLVDRPNDPIAAKTNMYQKQGRAQDLAMIQQLNEMLKGPEPGQGQQEPVMEEQMPMQAQEGVEIDYLKKIQEEYLKQFKEGQEPITQAPGEYGYLPQLTLAAQTALGLQGIASQQSQDPHFNVNPSRIDQMHPEYDPSIQLNALDANTVASLGPMMAKVKERGLSPLNTANYVAKAIADINTQKSNIADSSYKYNLKNMADKARFLTKNDEFNYGVDVRNISSANKKNQNFYNLAMSGMERGLGNAQNRRRYITEAEENRKNINNQLLQALLQADIFSKIKQ